MHPLDVHDFVEGLELDALPGQVESVALAVRPLVADGAARFRLADSDRHRPAVRAREPLSAEAWLRVRTAHEFGRGGEAACHYDVRIAPVLSARRFIGSIPCRWHLGE